MVWKQGRSVTKKNMVCKFRIQGRPKTSAGDYNTEQCIVLQFVLFDFFTTLYSFEGLNN